MHICRGFLPPVLHRVRSLFDQGIWSPRIFVGDIPRHGINVAPLLQGASGTDAHVTIFRGLDHSVANDTPPATDAIANGKIMRRGKGGD